MNPTADHMLHIVGREKWAAEHIGVGSWLEDLQEPMIIDQGEQEPYALTFALCHAFLDIGALRLIDLILAPPPKENGIFAHMKHRNEIYDEVIAATTRPDAAFSPDLLIRTLQREIIDGCQGKTGLRPDPHLFLDHATTPIYAMRKSATSPWHVSESLTRSRDFLLGVAIHDVFPPNDMEAAWGSPCLLPLVCNEVKWLIQRFIFAQICVVCKRPFLPYTKKHTLIAGVKTCSPECRRQWRDMRLLNSQGGKEGRRAYWRTRKRASLEGRTKTAKNGAKKGGPK